LNHPAAGRGNGSCLDATVAGNIKFDYDSTALFSQYSPPVP
jgi:hypothetical protein